MKKNNLLEIIGDCLIIAFGIVLLFQFITIGIMGRYGGEENNLVLWIEIIMSGLIVVIGTNRFIKDL